MSLKAKLNDTQVQELQGLNKANATFVPCWDGYYDAVAISKNEFDSPEFSDHKAKVETYNLDWQETGNDENFRI